MNMSFFGWTQAASVLLILSLTACGGGSSKTERDNSPGVTSTSSSSSLLSSNSSLTSSMSSAITSSSIISTSSSSSSSSVTVLSAKVSGTVELRDAGGEIMDIENPDAVVVNVALLNSEDQEVASNSFSLLDPVLQLDDSLPFAGEVKGDNASYLVVTVSAPGFTDYARRFELQEELNLRATLSQLPVETIPPSQITTVSGTSVSGFNFSVDGGAPQNAAGQTGVPELTVSIPQSALPAGTSSLDVQMRAFNPNNPDEAEYFPGAYEDSAGNKLLSVAFNYTDITTNTGASLQKLAQKTRALRQKTSASTQAQVAAEAQAEPVIINRKVPNESCAALKQLGDSSSELAGFQVPVYTYNPDTGLWDLLGQGTLYSADGTPVASDFTAFDCNSTAYVVEIKVTNEIFLSNWWNLDYPLVFNQPVKLCADLQLLDEANQPITGGYIYVSDDDDDRSISAETFTTDEQGNVRIEVYALDGNAVDTSAQLVLYSKNMFTSVTLPITLSTSCPAQVQVVKAAVPSLCKVQGRVLDQDGKPMADAVVLAGNLVEVEEQLTPALGVSDAQGFYQLDVACDRNYQVFEYLSLLMNYLEPQWLNNTHNFNVNGTVAASEVTDNGTTASLQDLMADHSKPLAYVFNEDEDPTKLRLQFLYAGEAYPLSYEFDVLNLQTNQVIGHFSGSLTKDDLEPVNSEDYFLLPAGSVLINNTLPNPDEFTLWSVKGTITSSDGKQGNVIGFIGNE
jgi:hypothetical protein